MKISIITFATGMAIIYINFTYFSSYTNIFTTLNPVSATIIGNILLIYKCLQNI